MQTSLSRTALHQGHDIKRDITQQHDDTRLPLFSHSAEVDELPPLWVTAIPKLTQHMGAGV
jgi:hypothetical protein